MGFAAVEVFDRVPHPLVYFFFNGWLRFSKKSTNARSSIQVDVGMLFDGGSTESFESAHAPSEHDDDNDKRFRFDPVQHDGLLAMGDVTRRLIASAPLSMCLTCLLSLYHQRSAKIARSAAGVKVVAAAAAEVVVAAAAVAVAAADAGEAAAQEAAAALVEAEEEEEGGTAAAVTRAPYSWATSRGERPTTTSSLLSRWACVDNRTSFASSGDGGGGGGGEDPPLLARTSWRLGARARTRRPRRCCSSR